MFKKNADDRSYIKEDGVVERSHIRPATSNEDVSSALKKKSCHATRLVHVTDAVSTCLGNVVKQSHVGLSIAVVYVGTTSQNLPQK